MSPAPKELTGMLWPRPGGRLSEERRWGRGGAASGVPPALTEHLLCACRSSPEQLPRGDKTRYGPFPITPKILRVKEPLEI